MPPMKSTAVPLDGLREALGQVIANERREWRRERELIEAQSRELIADLKAKVIELEQTVRTMVEARLAEVKDGAAGKDGAPGKDGENGKDGAAGKDGIAPNPEDMEPLVTAVVSRFVEAIPMPKDGKDGAPGKDGLDGKDGLLGADGQHGKDADPELVRSLVETTIAALPAAKDGLSVTVEDCLPVIEAAVSKAVAALPKAQDGKSVTTDDCRPLIEGAVQRAVAALPLAKDGAPGKLPRVKSWSDKVHYEADVVARDGSTYQALRDTAKPPPHEDWICLAQGGKHGRSPVPKGLYDETAEYSELDVVMLNGGSFIARADNPGPCPGDGWFLFASQGKQGKPGPASKGDRGPPGPTVENMTIDGDGILTIKNADGSVVTCDLYPLLSRI